MRPEADTRLDVLDVLRGVALLGMFLVHFSNFAAEGGPLDQTYQKMVALFFEERFWAMFGILFGVGFALQFRRAEARGEDYLPKYLRRMAALAAFGLIAHGVFGFNVLLGYAVWGLALPLVRRLSTPLLIVVLVVSATSFNLYSVAQATYGVQTKGVEAYRAERRDDAERYRAFASANRAAQDAPDFPTVFKARLRHMPWFYSQPFSFLPMNTMTLFLLGVLGLRLGLFDRPGEHRRLIAGLAIFGLAAWAFETFVSFSPPNPQAPFLRSLIVARLMFGFGLIRGMWLTFTYMGIVLLLVARSPVWLKRLSFFGWAGRMALTNYMVQIILLDLLFSQYAFGVSLRPIAGATAAIALFLADSAISRWWLARHRYGPLEWLWRSATYARWQPWSAAAVVTGRDDAIRAARP
jgi:uncharacterized protein